MDLNNLPTFEVLPKHIGFIMDGNGRWAKERGLPRYKGHIEGAKTFRKIGEFAGDLGIKYLTFYAFSTENWKRPREEVSAIMDLFREYLKELDERKAENEEKGIQVNFIGDKSGLPKDILAMMKYSERITKDKTKVYLNIAVNYGGRQEICRAAETLRQKGETITAEALEKQLYTADLQSLDFIIRTGGEYRLSNFLLWQSAYAELYFTPVLWPDFNQEEVERALSAFSSRSRRFGKN